MATTTNYSWSTPDDTALVKDGAAAIRSLGTAIDTTVFNNASAAIAKTIVDAKGDLIAATAADTVARLAYSGTNGDLLTVDTTTATGLKWATPAASGKVLQVVTATTSSLVNVQSTSYTDSGLTASITPTSATSKILVLVSQPVSLNRDANELPEASINLLRGATQIVEYPAFMFFRLSATGDSVYRSMNSMNYLDSPATTSSTTYKTQGKMSTTANSSSLRFQISSNLSQIVLLEIGA